MNFKKIKKDTGAFLILSFVLFQSVFSQIQANSLNEQSQSIDENIFSEKNIVPLMEKVFRWQINNPILSNEKYWNQWARSTFYSGAMYAFKTTENAIYLDQTIKWGKGWNWNRGIRYRNADDLACGNAYLDVYMVKKYRNVGENTVIHR